MNNQHHLYSQYILSRRFSLPVCSVFTVTKIHAKNGKEISKDNLHIVLHRAHNRMSFLTDKLTRCFH